MNKKRAILLVVVGFTAGIMLSNISFAEKSEDADNLYKDMELFSDALSIIRSEYVEVSKSKDLIYGALNGMLSSLDPYSQFMDPDMYKEMKIETEGEFGGIGIEISIRDNLLTIIAPIEDTPAYRVGLKAGDKIVKIDGEISKDFTLFEGVKRLRGKPGTDVEVLILRESERKLLDFKITRSIIKLESIKRAELIEPGFGYIRLVQFQENSGRDLESKLRELEKTDLKALILDLRNNPGGLLDSAVDVSEKFLEEGKVVVSTNGRADDQDFIFKSKRKSKHLGYPVAVLINGGSASASEIVAGALQDHKRAIIIGTKSFGKGSVQTVVPLSDGSAVRLTTSKYFTPSNRSIHNEGIEPDLTVPFREFKEKDKEPDIFDALLNDKDSEEEKKEQEEEEVKKKEYDNQVLTALDVLKGIVIYEDR